MVLVLNHFFFYFFNSIAMQSYCLQDVEFFSRLCIHCADKPSKNNDKKKLLTGPPE